MRLKAYVFLFALFFFFLFDRLCQACDQLWLETFGTQSSTLQLTTEIDNLNLMVIEISTTGLQLRHLILNNI